MQPTRHDPTHDVWRDAAVPGWGGRAVLAVLRSPLHRLLSRRLLGIAYEGARTGLRRALPVEYVRDGRRLVVWAANAGAKRWWRNFHRPGTVTVRIDGRDAPGTARVLTDPDEVARARRIYTARHPRATPADGDVFVAIDPSG